MTGIYVLVFMNLFQLRAVVDVFLEPANYTVVEADVVLQFTVTVKNSSLLDRPVQVLLRTRNGQAEGETGESVAV